MLTSVAEDPSGATVCTTQWNKINLLYLLFIQSKQILVHFHVQYHQFIYHVRVLLHLTQGCFVSTVNLWIYGLYNYFTASQMPCCDY